jgi:hypothetical protein
MFLATLQLLQLYLDAELASRAPRWCLANICNHWIKKLLCTFCRKRRPRAPKFVVKTYFRGVYGDIIIKWGGNM